MKRRLCIAATSVMVAAGLIGAAPASAETIGGTGSSGQQCFPGTWADVTYVVPPSGGTITSFSYESLAGAGETLDFLVLRPTGGYDYTVVGKTGPVTLAGTGAIETFPANILVQGGDIIGLWSGFGVLKCSRPGAAPGSIIGTEPVIGVPVDPGVGATVSFLGATAAENLNLSANLTTGPTSKAQCKNGGWRSFGTFKNQGACVTLFDTGT